MPTELSADFRATLERARARLDLGASVSAEPFSHSKTSNWVAKNGGLPHFIQHMAHDIMESDKDKTESEAIAIAISQCKKLAAKGNAKAAKAIAEWEQLKAKNKAKSANASAAYAEVDDVVELLLAVAAPDPIGALPGETPIDEGRYALALSAARLNLAMVFDPQKHPRGVHGHFAKALGDLKVGQAMTLPSGVTVTHKKNQHFTSEGSKHGQKPSLLFVHSAPGGAGTLTSGPEDAAKVALARHKKLATRGAPGDVGAEIQVPSLPYGTDLTKALKDGAASIPVGGEKTVAGSGLRIKREGDKLWRVYKSDGTAITTKGGIKGGPQAVANTIADTHLYEHGHPNFGTTPGKGERHKRESARAATAAKPENEIARLQRMLSELPQGNTNRTPEQQAQAAQARERIKSLREQLKGGGGGGGATMAR